MGIAIPIVIALASTLVPGVLLALALLKGTKLHLFEVIVIGFIFGLVAPATLTWLDSYFMDYIHFFSFSLELFEVNALIITLVGVAACWKEGVFKDMWARLRRNPNRERSAVAREYREDLSGIRSKLRKFEKAESLISRHEKEEAELKKKHSDEMELVSSFTEEETNKVIALHKKDELALEELHVSDERSLLEKLEGEPERRPAKGTKNWVWFVLLALILVTFTTRVMNIGVSSTFFQFDSYFDMLSTQRIITLGYQPLYSMAAWPVMANGTITRVQPLIPYLEAYWYSLANSFNGSLSTFNTTLMSDVSSIYPPITAALLVFAVFMLLYHEYDEYVALIGASLAASVPILFTTFIGGQQLLQPWGIFSLFLFFAAYLLAIKDMKNVRLAILAGVMFAFTFLGAHYYTVDAGVLALYIVVQGIISYLRGGVNRDFYKMNIIVIIVISIFLAVYEPYNAVYGSGLPNVLGIPITVALPAFALLLIAIIDWLPSYLKGRKMLFKSLGLRQRVSWLVLILVIVSIAVTVTPLGSPINHLLDLSVKFTTPSTPLFMTVQEYAPTGLLYNFGAAGMGMIAASAFGFPLLVYVVIAVAVVLLLIGIVYRRSDTSIFYLLISFPLAAAAFSEVAYIPHFAAAYVILFGVIIGEIGVLAGNDFKLSFDSHSTANLLRNAYSRHKDLMFAVFAVALFFLEPVLAMAFLLIILFMHKADSRGRIWALLVFFVIIEVVSIVGGFPITGEASSIYQAFAAYSAYSSNPSTACSVISSTNNNVGANMFCNTIPSYWLDSMSFIKSNIGPDGPRVLSWWDYGDWINWFGQTPAVLRGDNSVPKEDFATAANFVLGPKEGYGPAELANFMNTNETGYVLFDQDLIGKWGALDYLACININATSRAFAIAQGKQQSPQQPFVLGTSQCEVSHDMQFVLVPLPALAPTLQQPSLSDYCSISSNSTQYALSYFVIGQSLSNDTGCLSLQPTSNGAAWLYYKNGTRMNAVVQIGTQQPVGATKLSSTGPTYLEYPVVYLPDSNGTVSDAPTEFYNSNFYKGFFLGDLPGFTQVYPSNSTGINFVNGTYPVRIYKLDNFTGEMPSHNEKPSYVHNNYTMP